MINNMTHIISARPKDIGIPVRRILPWAKKRMVGPFIFLDHMGPAFLKAPDERIDVRPHPHIGLSTLTYLFKGSLLHRDSLGHVQEILPGQVNWMTAGRGISHSERETEEARNQDRTIEGLQFWVALPVEFEDIEPSFIHYKQDDIPEIEDESLSINLVAGEYHGHVSKLHSYAPMIYMLMSAKKEDEFTYHHPIHELAIYVAKGQVKIKSSDVLHEFEEGQMIVFEKGSSIELTFSKDAVFALIGGETYPEPRYIWWNLVSSSQEKIEQAKKAWIDGTFPQVPGDAEKIPLPE